MRGVLFRGKRTDDGQWVYGYLVKKIYGSTPVIIKDAFMEDDCHIFFEYEHVDPSTVGQYTGKIDKNGTRIFEGDIIALTPRVRCEVFWDERAAAFHARWYDRHGDYCVNSLYGAESVEVISTIYENPEWPYSFTPRGGTDNG